MGLSSKFAIANDQKYEKADFSNISDSYLAAIFSRFNSSYCSCNDHFNVAWRRKFLGFLAGKTLVKIRMSDFFGESRGEW